MTAITIKIEDDSATIKEQARIIESLRARNADLERAATDLLSATYPIIAARALTALSLREIAVASLMLERHFLRR